MNKNKFFLVAKKNGLPFIFLEIFFCLAMVKKPVTLINFTLEKSQLFYQLILSDLGFKLYPFY